MTKLLAFANAARYLGVTQANQTAIIVSGTPVNASAPIPEAFVSYSIEFAFFPDFAGLFTSSELWKMCLYVTREFFITKYLLKQSLE